MTTSGMSLWTSVPLHVLYKDVCMHDCVLPDTDTSLVHSVCFISAKSNVIFFAILLFLPCASAT